MLLGMRPRPLLLLMPVVLLGLVLAPVIWRVGAVRDGRRLIATGQTLALDPKAISLPARGIDMALGADGEIAYVKTTRGVSKVDLATGKTVAEARTKGASLCGIDVGEVGVVVTDSSRNLLVLDPATLAERRNVDLGEAKVGGPSYPCGVRVAGHIAYVALNRANTLAIVDLDTGTFRTVGVGVAPYGVAVAGDRVFVSCWGRSPERGRLHATSAKVEVEVDARGVPTGGTLVELDAKGEKRREWKVGGQPTEIAIAPDGVYVACANADAIFRIGPDGSIRETRIAGLAGAAPSSLAPGGDLLWVALSGENRVMALDRKTGKTHGSLETGWYPVAVRHGIKGLVVADAKGAGGPTKNATELVGSVRLLDPKALRPIRQVAKAARAKMPVHHAVYIIKENRTYDQVLGDMPEGKGDPSFTMYGREVTPNHHALAKEFVLLDNFADNGTLSTDGHAWAVEGQATTFYERSFGGWTRAYPFGGDEPLAISGGGHLWDAALAVGRTFRNYGEFMYANGGGSFAANYKTWKAGGVIPFKASIGVERVKRYTDMAYPGWNLDIPDGYRADRFLKEFREMERKGRMPDLMVLYLPQDHTSGDAPGAATPRAHVADNDLAVGRIVEAISRSEFWKDTAVFVLEDDPQDGLDSVDGHRSLCLVASPYTRGAGTVSTFYNQTSVLHTICDMIGAKPFTRFVAESPSMAPLFERRIDLTPYRAKPVTIALDTLNPPEKNAAKLDLSGPDATDERRMDRVLWSMAFPDRPYPHDD